MEFREYVALLKKYWVLILCTTLAGLALGTGYSFLATPEYQSRTQLYVSVQSAGSTGELMQGATYSTQVVNSYVNVVKTSVVLDPVIDELGLDTTSAKLASSINASAKPTTALIDIAVTDNSPKRSAEIADAVGESLKRVVQSQLEHDPEGKKSLVNLTTTQKAIEPDSPVSPNRLLDILIGLFLGLAVGIGYALLRDALDTRIHSLKDIADATDKPLLGGILNDPQAASNPLTLRTMPRSPRAESFRSLRTNLQFVNLDNESKLFVMTSPNPGEGKSTTTANLALALAEAGSKVVLIEADLRLPKVHEYMNVEGASGLTDLLIGKAELDDVLQRWGRTSLSFLPAGHIPPNPSELLGSGAMNRLLDKLIDEFDYIIVDAPPVLAVTDAAVIGHGRSKVLVAVAAGSTRKHELESALKALDHAGAEVVGIIVTMLSAKAAGVYGYGSYGYGYGEKEAKHSQVAANE